jgi:hypothetical protein
LRLAADIAEARERDLLERVEKAENMERIALARLEAREKELLTEKAALIAEFRELSRGFIGWDEKFYEQNCGDYIETKSLEAILAKYEEKP